MFDEFKVNGVRLKLTPTFQVASPASFAPSERPTMVWAWDRNGITMPSTPNTLASQQAYSLVSSYGSARTASLGPS